MEYYAEKVCRKLRETAKEFGQSRIDSAVIIGNEWEGDTLGGHTFIHAPTVHLTMGNAEFKIVRFFEDI